VTVTVGGNTTVGGASGAVLFPSTKGSVEIDTNIPGATVYIDGKNTNLTINDTNYVLSNVSPGTHSFTSALMGSKM